MGFVSKIFGGGGGGSSKQPPTAEERELARQGIQRYNRYAARYAPLEDAAIDNIDRPTERLISGRTNADIMQEATTQATRSIGGSDLAGGIESLRSLSGAITRSSGQGEVAGIVGSRGQRDERAMSMIETGIGMSGRQVAGLSQLGSQTNRRALAELEAEEMERNARNQAIGSVLGTAVGAGAAIHTENKERERLDSILSRYNRAPALTDFRSYGR